MDFDRWVPGGRRKLQSVTGVDPWLWPAGRYADVERCCAEIPPNHELGANWEPKWWRTPSEELNYTAVDGAGKTTNRAQAYQAGRSLSHLLAWMDARASNASSAIVSESGAGLSLFGAAGEMEDFRRVVPALLRETPEGWHIVMLDKCTLGSEGTPAATFAWKPDPESAYNVYRWVGFTTEGNGVAGAGLYLASAAFLQMVPSLVHDYGFFMVDAYLGYLCKNKDLRCYSACAVSKLPS